jgi:hypothetical protein
MLHGDLHHAVMTFTSHQQIIDAVWDTYAAYADDIGVVYGTAIYHCKRNAIPSEYWPAVAAAAQKRGFPDVTEKLLAELKRPRKKARRAVAPMPNGLCMAV